MTEWWYALSPARCALFNAPLFNGCTLMLCTRKEACNNMPPIAKCTYNQILWYAYLSSITMATITICMTREVVMRSNNMCRSHLGSEVYEHLNFCYYNILICTQFWLIWYYILCSLSGCKFVLGQASAIEPHTSVTALQYA